MLKPLFDPQADQDLDTIYDHYLAKRQSMTGLLHIQTAIDNAIYGVLVTQPFAGSDVALKNTTARKFLAGREIWIIYTIKDPDIVILRLLPARGVTNWENVEIAHPPL